MDHRRQNLFKLAETLTTIKGNKSSTKEEEESEYLFTMTRPIAKETKNNNNKNRRNLLSFTFVALIATTALLLLVQTTLAIDNNNNNDDTTNNRHQYSNRDPLHHERVKRQAATPTTTSAPPTTTLAPSSEGAPTTLSPALTTTEESVRSPATKPPIPAVNYTLVDELFKADYPDQLVVAKWRNMSDLLKRGVNDIVKIVMPKLVAMSSDAKVSGNCSGGILKWVMSLRQLRSWSLQMLDAIGKPNAGIFEGALTMFGNYKQCLSIRVPDEDEIEINDVYKEYMRGKYCVLHLKPFMPKKQPFYGLNATFKPLLRNNYKYYEKTVYDDFAELAMAFNFLNIRLDLCVPSVCSRDDIQRVANFLSDMLQMRAKVARCDVDPAEDVSIIDHHHLMWGAGMLAAIAIVLVSSAFGVVSVMVQKQKSKTCALLTSMSVQRSLNQYLSIDCDRLAHRKSLAIYGLRLIVVLWVFLVHSSGNLNYQFLREMLTLRRLIMEWPMQLIINSSLQFDTLIMLTAFTITYYNVDSNMKDLIKYTIDKYVRLMPSIMFLVGLTILTPLFYQSHSPLWKDFVDDQSELCKSTGLLDLTFLQNFLSYKHICLPQTWIFCVELQLLVLALPIIYLVNKDQETKQVRQGSSEFLHGSMLFLVLIAASGWFINFASTYWNELPPAWFYTFPDREDRALYFTRHLMKTWNHLSPFAIGLIMGFVCKNRVSQAFNGQQSAGSSQPIRCALCVASLLIMTAIVYSTWSWSVVSLPSFMISALYDATSRLVWSMAFAVILYNVSVPDKHHQYSCLANLLGSRLFVALGRLSFLAYMIYPYVHTFVLAVQEQPIFSSIFMLFHTFLGNIILTYILAFLISILIELPFRRLIKKCALGRKHCTQLNISSQLSDSCESPALMKPTKMAHQMAEASNNKSHLPPRSTSAKPMKGAPTPVGQNSQGRSGRIPTDAHPMTPLPAATKKS